MADFLFTNGFQPGEYYHLLMFVMMIVIFIIIMWLVLVSFYRMMTGSEGMTSDPLGGLTAGRALQSAIATDTGTPGGVIAYQSFVNPEPPVFYNIGDVEATRAIRSAGAAAEGLAPRIGGLAPRVGGMWPFPKKGGLSDYDRGAKWRAGAFGDDRALLAQAQHN